MKKVLFYLTFLLGLILLSPNSALADISCQPIYGGGQNCVTIGKTIINKTVQNPQTSQFVDNLGTNDPKFSPNQTVTFQISITNTGSTVVPQVVIKDVFPNFVNFSSGAGNFDANSKTLTFLAFNLNPNETRNFAIQGKIADASLIPSTNMITCVVNQSILTATDSSQAQDNSQFCIQVPQTTTKGGLPIFPPTKITSTPSTGPEMLPLIGLLPAGLSGWFMRKKSFKSQGGER